ncbi:MAG TPA: YicC/YloC family endoribonuclease [Candidatus Acidoferrales bacterium]|nr:YicC/YloC family endoribonuclease [Candidatus Acidoferrales bacterium]
MAPRSSGIRSMTGYAQARAEENGLALRVSVRSVNHRFLDLHVRLPEGWEPLEPRLRQRVRQHVRRGHVDVTLRVEPSGPAAVQVNHPLAAAYARAAQELSREFSMPPSVDFVALFRLPGVVTGAGVPTEEEVERAAALAGRCLDEALARLDEMRATEGAALAAEMRGRLASIASHAKEIEALAATLRPEYARRLGERLAELLANTSMDPARLAQEAALLAERSDISEEVTRLRSHLQQFDALLESDPEAGKKLDFLLQEMQRESNTMLSKTPGVESQGLAITDLALEVKAEVERLREQMQNVE